MRPLEEKRKDSMNCIGLERYLGIFVCFKEGDLEADCNRPQPIKSHVKQFCAKVDLPSGQVVCSRAGRGRRKQTAQSSQATRSYSQHADVICRGNFTAFVVRPPGVAL